MTVLATAVTALTITVWPQGLDGPSERWTLRCGPTGGTLPARVAACRKLNSLSAPFRPIGKDSGLHGDLRGPGGGARHRVVPRAKLWAEFRRRNGCEIDRWERVRPLLPRAATRSVSPS